MDKTTSKCVDVTCSSANCLECDLNGLCTVCYPGFTVQGSECVSCQVQFCSVCSSSVSGCDTCNEGYIYHSSQKKCLPCAASCKSCKSSDISECVECISGYYVSLVDGKNTCTKCFDNCAICYNGTTCAECSKGFSLKNNKTVCSI